MANRLIKVAVQRFSAASSREGLGGAVTEKDNTGRKLERRVADLYRRIGAHKVEHDVEIAGHQIDVYVEMPTWDHSVHRIIVQAKDWSGKVGIAEVATFQGVMRPLRDAHHADEGVMVSAVGYSKQGRNAAKTHGIRLLEIEDLESMADRAEKENVEPVGRQRQLYHALKSRSDPLAAIYLGAWMMARSHSNPDWMALAAHGMRELLDALADSGAGKTGSRPNLQHQVNGLREKWKRMVGQSTCYNSGNWNGPVDPGLRAFLRAARGFFEMQTQRFPTKPEKAKQTLLRFDLAPVPVDDTLLKLGSDKWMEFHKFFSRVAHHELVPDAAQLQERIAQCERFLLDRLIPDTFNDLRDVDEIIEEGETIGVTDELVERALDIIARRGVSCSHFFEHLSSPEWIRPLRDKDVFSTPPSPVVEGDTISLPPWFQSRYLARMASKAPDVVLEVIQGIPSTTNPRIHDNFVEAALAMSARLSAELAQQALKWLDCSYPQHLAKLVVHLAQGGEVEQALPLAGSLLAIDVADTDNHRVKPKARISEWEYGEIAKEVVPALVEAAGDLTLRMLCDVLDRAVRLSRYDPDTAGGEDNSDIWRPAVEQDHDRHSHQVTDYLVTGVRDAADALGASGADAVRNVVQCLGSYRWRIFRRLEMYVLRVAMDGPLELIGERLMNPDLFRWPDHEYIMLLQQFYPRLSSSDRARILKLIDAGPDHEPSQEGEDPREYAERWQRNRLAIVAEYLPSGWKRRYEKLVEQHGEAVSLDRPARVFSGRCGPTSPKSAGELAAMSVADIVAYLQTWVPPGHWEDGTPLGLARVLEEVVRQDALRFASEATRFCEIDEPTYVRAVLEGLPAAVGKEGFDWARVLDLCDCVAGRPTETRQPKVGFDEKDPDWNGARRVVAKLFQCAFGTEGRIPFDLRERVWRTIAALACDPGPSPERESGSAMLDPTTQAINSTRGVAMEAVLRYAFWVHARQCGHDKRFPCTFDIMPEVRAVLDWHLDASNDPSPAVRSVYGEHFADLLLIDREWATANVSRIFPSDAAARELLDAAWNSYIVRCRPYSNVYPVLERQYRAAADRLGKSGADGRLARDPDERLAEHLLLFYAHGLIDISEGTNPVSLFFQHASDELRGHAIGFVGRTLRDDTEKELPKAVVARLQRLWEWRVGIAGENQPKQNHFAELTSFGWWFVCGKFPRKWALQHLQLVLKLVSWVEPDDNVVKELTEVAKTQPHAAVECLGRLVHGLKGWQPSWLGQAHDMLKVALQDEETQHDARRVVDRFGERGFINEFQDLGETDRQ